MNCINCNSRTSNPKFCSKSCAAIHNNKHFPKRSKKERPPKKIVIPLDTRTKKELLDRGGYKSNVYGLIRFHARRFIYRHKDKVCEKCGYDKHVEVCHITPIKDFPDDTLISTINSLENLLILCPNCHWEHDNL